MESSSEAYDTFDPEEPEDPMAFKHIAGVFIAIFLVGIIGNSTVIYVLFRQRRTWNITTTYLFNLAIADTIFVCTLPLWAQSYLNRLEWKFGLFMCKLVGVAGGLNMYASIFFLTAMSVDRWIAVVHATTINTARSSVVARVTCAAVWLTAAVFSVPRMLYQVLIEYKVDGVKNSTPSAPNTSTAYITTTLPNISVEAVAAKDSKLQCMFYLPKTENKEILMGLLEFVQAVVGFMIPMTIVCVCYLRIVRTVRLKLISRRVRKERVAMLAGIIVTAFFVCWIPMQLMTLYSAFGGWWNLFNFDEKFYQSVYPFCVCLAFANSCMNPFVYAFTATNFKNNVKEVCGSNVGACKNSRVYKMTIARSRNQPFTPDKAGATDSKKNLRSSIDKKNGHADKQVDPHDMSSTDDIYEPLHPVNQKRQGDENLGARGPPECRHLAIEDTTSGIYYEYFSSPAVLHTTPETRVKKTTTRADIINHNDQAMHSEIHLSENINAAPKVTARDC